MPADRIPTTHEEWTAITPNETDHAIVSYWEEEPAKWAAAARIAEHERCVYVLAGYLSTLPGNTGKHPSEMLPEARRILEDR